MFSTRNQNNLLKIEGWCKGIQLDGWVSHFQVDFKAFRSNNNVYGPYSFEGKLIFLFCSSLIPQIFDAFCLQ